MSFPAYYLYSAKFVGEIDLAINNKECIVFCHSGAIYVAAVGYSLA